MIELALAVTVFLGFHLIPSSPLRARAVSAWGEQTYLAVFSIASGVLLVLMIWAFIVTPAGPKLWYPSTPWHLVHAALVLLASFFIVAGTSRPNPSAVGQAQTLGRDDIASGITSITRHPVMWGIALWAFAHLVSQSSLRGVLFFGSFLVLALAGALVIDRRKRKELGEAWCSFEARTSFMPFAAILTGRARLDLRNIGWRPIIAALLIWAAVLHIHPWLFGVLPLPALGL